MSELVIPENISDKVRSYAKQIVAHDRFETNAVQELLDDYDVRYEPFLAFAAGLNLEVEYITKLVTAKESPFFEEVLGMNPKNLQLSAFEALPDALEIGVSPVAYTNALLFLSGKSEACDSEYDVNERNDSWVDKEFKRLLEVRSFSELEEAMHAADDVASFYADTFEERDPKVVLLPLEKRETELRWTLKEYLEEQGYLVHTKKNLDSAFEDSAFYIPTADNRTSQWFFTKNLAPFPNEKELFNKAYLTDLVHQYNAENPEHPIAIAPSLVVRNPDEQKEDLSKFYEETTGPWIAKQFEGSGGHGNKKIDAPRSDVYNRVLSQSVGEKDGSLDFVIVDGQIVYSAYREGEVTHGGQMLGEQTLTFDRNTERVLEKILSVHPVDQAVGCLDFRVEGEKKYLLEVNMHLPGGSALNQLATEKNTHSFYDLFVDAIEGMSGADLRERYHGNITPFKGSLQAN